MLVLKSCAENARLAQVPTRRAVAYPNNAAILDDGEDITVSRAGGTSVADACTTCACPVRRVRREVETYAVLLNPN